MIPRTARRLETTLLTSRQRLPRPARLYSTPSKRANAPALATATLPQTDYTFMVNQAHQTQKQNAEAASAPTDLHGFLKRRAAYAILPAPLPNDRTSPLNDMYYTDSPTLDLLSVMDACLHNLYDVPRAQQVFDRMRDSKPGDPTLTSELYDAFLDAYTQMAYERDTKKRSTWVDDAWALYQAMELNLNAPKPTACTYAVMLLIWHRFGPQSEDPVDMDPSFTPAALLNSLVDRNISIAEVIANRVIESTEDAASIMKILSRAAVELNMSRVVSELGQTEAMGQYPDPLADVPEVLPVLRPLKSIAGEDEGVERSAGDGEPVEEFEIPFNLSILRKHLAQVNYARRLLPDDAQSRQKLLEESVYDVAVARLQHQADLFEQLGLGSGGLNQADLQRWMWDWHTKLKARLELEVRAIIEHEKTSPVRLTQVPLGPFMSLVQAERLSLLTILEIMRLQGSGGVADGMKTARALISVGRAVEIEYKAQMCKKNNIYIPTTRPNDNPSYFSQFGYKHLHERRVAAAKYTEDAEDWTSPWTHIVRIKVGSILVDSLMDVAEVTRTATNKAGEIITEDQPAFYHSYEYVRGQKLGVIRLNPVVAERIAKDNVRETLHPRHLPMLVKPRPWLGPDNGGYFYNKTSAMRFKDSQEQLSYLRHASSLGNVELVYAGLDVLGSTPWRINRDVFDIVLKVWNTGQRMGKMPPAKYDQPEPEKPENFDSDMKAKSVYLQKQKSYMAAKANNHSERCNVNYKIEIARTFLADTIFFPHNLDFRGRAYPIPPHFNHIGDDLSRGLLAFADAKPLGERGLRWLKIHLANLYGYDKANFDERVEFVHEHLKDIYDSAENPLEGKKWWTKADDPWQCLATCMELRNALESPDPHAFLSSLPVHQDGTCNGLQHYAALGGDRQGAAQVNLSATDRPSDVYTYVGNMVEEIIAQDIAKGDKYAIMLQGKVSRKVVKQTVMTTVYGVTFVGARDQIEKQLKDRRDVPEEECWPAASYLAKRVLACIGDLFTGAKDIQTWLNLCARLISKSIPAERIPEAMSEHYVRTRGRAHKNSLPLNRLKKEQMTSVVWTTPLGLPIVQPYRKTKRKQVMTALQTVFISDPNSPAEVNSLKQATAFPPNFIHSLDATHMMLTALECRTLGLNFASVHDSYWTHACDIDKMSEVIRDSFIALHSSDVLKRLHEEFRERYKGYKVPLILVKGPLAKHLSQAGSKIVATSAQAQELSGISDLVVVSETTKPMVEDLGPNSVSAASLAASVAGDAGVSEAGEIVEPEDAPDRRKKKISPLEESDEIEVDELSAKLLGKFVDLSDLLPPLPEKGDFNVETIKRSQYFFS